MKKKKKRSVGLAAGIMICAIVLLCGVLVMVTYAQKQKEPPVFGDQEEQTEKTEPIQEIQPEQSGEDPSGTKPEISKAKQQVAEDQKPEDQASGRTGAADSRVEEKLKGMSLEEKVAQLFILTPEALTGAGKVTAAGEKTKEAIDRYPVGGLVYFEGNLNSPRQVQDMLSGVQEYAKERIGIPMFLAVDEEGGTVRRISGRSSFGIEKIPDMAEIGASGDDSQAYEVGKTIGGYLKELGFNLDFAPVADVLDSEDNSLWSRRSFGMDADLTGEMVAQEVRGMQEAGVLAAVKHFPGHGSARTDSHEGIAVVDKSWEELKESDIVPFAAGIEAGAQVVMAGHLSVPQVVGDDTPSSLSYRMITEILRNELGYEGLVVTDALNMGAVTDQYPAEKAAVKAVMAGADLLLMPEDFSLAYQGILDAVKRGSITERRLDESVKRILSVKFAAT